MDERWDSIPADAFMEIVQRLPTSARWWLLRLVCRHWRNVIDEHTPRPQPRAKVLAFVAGHDDDPRSCRAYVFDDLSTAEQTGGRDLNLRGSAAESDVNMVGTCNGLLCLRRGLGDVVVLNPVTGEKVAVPPPSETPGARWDTATYSFGYHRATGLYKIVQVPCYEDGANVAFAAVNVFTLGERSWRKVRVPRGSRCLLGFGLVTVNGATHWVAADAHSLMAFDLGDGRLRLVTTLPVRVREWRGDGDLSWHLTADIYGRLGLVVCSSYDQNRNRAVTVWTLEDDGGGRNKKEGTPWVLRQTIVEPGRKKPLQELAWPHGTHGDHVLTTCAWQGNWGSLHAHRRSEASSRTKCSVVRVGCAPPLIGLYDNCRSIRTFAYVETTEPLALYAWEDRDIGDKEEWDWRFSRSKRQWKFLPCSWLDAIPES